MNLREPVASAIRAIKANPLRSTLTTLGIIIGVSAVLVVVSLIEGLRGSILKQIERAGSRTLFIRPILPGEIPSEAYFRLKNRELTLDTMRAVAIQVPQIGSVTPIYTGSYEVSTNGHAVTSRMLLTTDGYQELNGVIVRFGRGLVPTDLRMARKVAVIGASLAEKLGLGSNPVGRYVRVNNALGLEIVGVLETQGGNLVQDPDDILIVPLTTGFPQLADAQRRQLAFQARVLPPLSVDDGVERLTEALRRIQGLRGDQANGFKVLSPKQIAGIVNNITAAITLVAGSMVSVALLVGGIGIMNIMLVSVTERTREIGIRKAIGARRNEILTQFLVEAILLCLMGGTIGILLGLALGTALGKILLGGVYLVPLWAILGAFLVPMTIGVVFGLYPAARASKLDPIEALHYE